MVKNRIWNGPDSHTLWYSIPTSLDALLLLTISKSSHSNTEKYGELFFWWDMLCVAESGLSLELANQFLENKLVHPHHLMEPFWVSYVERCEIKYTKNTLSTTAPWRSSLSHPCPVRTDVCIGISACSVAWHGVLLLHPLQQPSAVASDSFGAEPGAVEYFSVVWVVEVNESPWYCRNSLATNYAVCGVCDKIVTTNKLSLL